MPIYSETAGVQVVSCLSVGEDHRVSNGCFKRTASRWAGLFAILLLCGLPMQLPAEQQDPRPPSVPAPPTPQQQAELDELSRKADAAYNRADLKASVPLWQAAVAKARALHNTVYISTFVNNLGIVYERLGQL